MSRNVPRITIPNPVIRQLPSPNIRNTPPPVVRGIKPPVISVPDPTIQYPTIDVPTEEDFRNQMQQGQNGGEAQEEDSRTLGPPTAEVGVPPTLTIPGGINIPIPTNDVIAATAGVAAVSTASALAATTALKPVFEWLLKLMKTAMKQVVDKVKKKLTKEKPEDSSPGSDSTH